MSDLWPDFKDMQKSAENNSISIMSEQAHILGRKLDGKVKAIFSEMQYYHVESNSGILTALDGISKYYNPKKEEVLEENLQGKIDLRNKLSEQKYKFEIYNDKYRFRLFIYIYSPLYPNKILIDENIAKEIENGKGEISIENDGMLVDLLRSIFSSEQVIRIIRAMMST